MAKTAAIINNSIVSNIIIVDDIEQSAKDLNAVLVEYTEENPAGIGYIYDEATGKFNRPAVSEVQE